MFNAHSIRRRNRTQHRRFDQMADQTQAAPSSLASLPAEAHRSLVELRLSQSEDLRKISRKNTAARDEDKKKENLKKIARIEGHVSFSLKVGFSETSRQRYCFRHEFSQFLQAALLSSREFR